MIWNIKPSYVFRKDYRGLPDDIRRNIPGILEALLEDPYQDFLHTHPLHDKLSGYHACSIDDDYRIIMRISSEKGLITLMDVGNHAIYKRY